MPLRRLAALSGAQRSPAAPQKHPLAQPEFRPGRTAVFPAPVC